MLIILFNDLFVFDILLNEGVMVMLLGCVVMQDIWFLCIGFLNLMFKKIQIENQFVCVIGVILLQIDFQLICMFDYESCNIVVDYL